MNSQAPEFDLASQPAPRRRTARAKMLAAVGLISLGAPMVASKVDAHSGNSSRDYLHLCINRTTAQVRAEWYNAAIQCPVGFSAVHVPLTGGAGAVGPQGPAGDTGAQGPQGPQGEVGPQGDKGDTGATGDKGDTGATGDTGAKGDTGATGDTGAKGDTGATGDTGAKGDTGDTGDQGLADPQGPEGPAGPQGDKGDTGDQGLQGEQGLQGSSGTNGTNGTNGATIIAGGGSPSTSSTNYLPFGLLSQSATESNVRMPSPVAGALGTLTVKTSDDAGGGNTWTFTIVRNGSDTALTCSISGSSATTCSFSSSTVAIAVGDTLSLKAVPASGPNSAVVTWAARIG